MRVLDEEDKLPAKEHATYRVGLVLCYISPNKADLIVPMQ